MKTLNPSKRELRKTLLESLFDPRERTPLTIILEIANEQYLKDRAIEMIRSENDLTKAIALLAVAKLFKIQKPKKEKKKKEEMTPESTGKKINGSY